MADNRKLLNSELQRKSVDDFKEAQKTPIVVVLDNVRSLNNIGSVFRTCDAFAAEAIYLCGITATPPNKDIHKTALGATESVAWKYYAKTETIIEELRQSGYTILSVEQAENSIHLNEYKILPEGKYALIFGHEIHGVSQDIVNMSDSCIEIPQWGTKHSLNVAVSVGVVLWDFFKALSIDSRQK